MGSVIFAIFYVPDGNGCGGGRNESFYGGRRRFSQVLLQRWIMGARTPGDVKLRFTAALRIKPENARILDRVFHEVSDPDHEKYGQHWSRTEMSALLQPAPNHMSAFRKFFLKHGPSHALSTEGELATFELTASQAEAFFNTEFFEFRHRFAPVSCSTELHRVTLSLLKWPMLCYRWTASFAYHICGQLDTRQESNG